MIGEVLQKNPAGLLKEEGVNSGERREKRDAKEVKP